MVAAGSAKELSGFRFTPESEGDPRGLVPGTRFLEARKRALEIAVLELHFSGTKVVAACDESPHEALVGCRGQKKLHQAPDDQEPRDGICHNHHRRFRNELEYTAVGHGLELEAVRYPGKIENGGYHEAGNEKHRRTPRLRGEGEEENGEEKRRIHLRHFILVVERAILVSLQGRPAA